MFSIYFYTTIYVLTFFLPPEDSYIDPIEMLLTTVTVRSTDVLLEWCGSRILDPDRTKLQRPSPTTITIPERNPNLSNLNYVYIFTVESGVLLIQTERGLSGFLEDLEELPSLRTSETLLSGASH